MVWKALSRFEPAGAPRDHSTRPSRRWPVIGPRQHEAFGIPYLRHQAFSNCTILCNHTPSHPRCHVQCRALNAQHPAQRRQNPSRLRHIAHQRHHFRVAQQMRKLRGMARRLITHQMNKPPEPPWKLDRPGDRKPNSIHRRRNRTRSASNYFHPARPNPLHQRQQFGAGPVHAFIASHRQIRRQRSRTPAAPQTRRHSPANP